MSNDQDDERAASPAPSAASAGGNSRGLVIGLLGAVIGIGAFYGFQQMKARSDARNVEVSCTAGQVDSCRQLCERTPADLPACLKVAASLVASAGDDLKTDNGANLLWRKACDGGNGEGCARLGRAQFNGRGLPRDMAGAAASFKKACDLGNGLGCAGYGQVLARGEGGVTRDEPKAVEFFKKACDLGEPRGCADLATAYLNGIGVTKDEAKAISLFDDSCEDRLLAEMLVYHHHAFWLAPVLATIATAYLVPLLVL